MGRKEIHLGTSHLGSPSRPQAGSVSAAEPNRLALPLWGQTWGSAGIGQANVIYLPGAYHVPGAGALACKPISFTHHNHVLHQTGAS